MSVQAENSLYRLSAVNDSLLVGNSFSIVKLRHPKTREASHFAFTEDDGQAFEVLSHKPEFGCWFVGSEISSDGSLIIITPYDPRFIILPYLLKQHLVNADRYSPLEQILEDEEFPHNRRLRNYAKLESLGTIADCKALDDTTFYRYNKSKTLVWLQNKVARVADHLKGEKMHVTAGAQAATYVSSKVEEAHDDDYQHYAYGIVAEYLPTELGEELRQCLGIKEELEPVNAVQPNKKSKTGGGPLQDYSKTVLLEKQSQQKLTATQKKLAKIDKTGMKSLTSFFSPKAKNV